MTAGEGEFLGLGREEAARRMAAGRKLVEDITGKAAAGFVAPAWLYGEGALAALCSSDFALAEDHMRVWRPQSGETLARGPVITWASRSPMRTASSLAFAALARRALRPLDVVRVAAHPGDTNKAAPAWCWGSRRRRCWARGTSGPPILGSPACHHRR
jgi:predicted deacetylase